MNDALEIFKKEIDLKFPDAMLSDREIAIILRKNVTTISRMRLKGQGPHFFKVGKRVLCMKEDFFNWLFANYHQSNT